MGHNVSKASVMQTADSLTVGTVVYGVGYWNTLSNNWGYKMQFARALELSAATPTSVLCEAWGASPEHVAGRKRGEVPMNLREAGDLAKLHGMNLEDVLPI